MKYSIVERKRGCNFVFKNHQMKKQNGFVSYVLESGDIQILLSADSFIMARVDKINGKVPSPEEVKRLLDKKIEYIVTKNLAAHTVLIEI